MENTRLRRLLQYLVMEIHNVTTTLGCDEIYAAEGTLSIVLGLVFAALALSGIFWNGLLLYLNMAKGKVEGDFKYFFANLAICDLVFCAALLANKINSFVGCALSDLFGFNATVCAPRQPFVCLGGGSVLHTFCLWQTPKLNSPSTP